MQKAIVIGASSGLGLELARLFSRDGFGVGLASRNVEALNKLRDELPGQAWVKAIDVTRCDEAMSLLRELIGEMGGADVVVISSGLGHLNQAIEWGKDKSIIDVNVAGFTAMANEAFRYFAERGGGQIVGISSIAGLRGGGDAPAYNASKAFEANYMTGLRVRSRIKKLNITITDVKPGFVDTPLTHGQRGLFWLIPCEKAARQIYAAIRKKKSHAYITKRWSLMAWGTNLIPEWLYARIESKSRY